MKRCKIKNKWFDAGKTGVILINEPAQDRNGMDWTAVLWDDEEDPTFHKSCGLIIDEKTNTRDSFTAIIETAYGLREQSDIGDLHTVTEFLECCAELEIIDYDGFGHLATHDKESTINIVPSSRRKTLTLNPWATHVMWFNK